MASTNLDNTGVLLLQVPNWDFGIDTSKPAAEIADNAAQDILNYEFDENSNLSTRAGILELYSDTFADRITSLHYFKNETGEIGLLWTTGTSLYIGETNGTGVTNLTGALTLPDDTFWQWVTFNGLAIGVNKATSGSNPVKVNGSSVAAALGGSPPKGKYITVWNDRIWIVSATDPNTLWGSVLGNPESWSTVSASGTEAAAFEIDADDGDQITGLHATKDTLFVFKREKIYKLVLIDSNQPATDITNLRIQLHAKNIGCVSPYSIQGMLDDVVFLSQIGVVSLRLSEAVEAFRTTVLSKNVGEIRKTPKATEEIPAVLMDTATQYWLSIPAEISLTESAQAFILDYSGALERVYRWTRFDGLAAGTAFTKWDGQDGTTFVIGATNADGTSQIFTYIPRNTTRLFTDNGTGYRKSIITKAYTIDVPLRNKEWQKWAFGFGLWTAQAQVAIGYYFNGNQARGGDYSFLITSPGSGALWDEAIWDTDLWDSAVIVDQDIIRRFKEDPTIGRRSQNVVFTVVNDQDEEGFIIKDFNLYYSFLTEKGVSDL
jgi:hypothetical protein